MRKKFEPEIRLGPKL